jgi:hypothetical protein
MPNSVKGVDGIGNDRSVSPVEAAMEARERRVAQAKEEKLRAELAERRGEGAPGAADAANPSTAVQGVTAVERIPPYRVQLDPGTKHLYTEVLDTSTGEVVLRIPQGYVDPEDVLDPEMPPDDRNRLGGGSVDA